jgi:hypothetical protein
MCCIFIHEVAAAVFCYYLSIMNAIESDSLLLGRQCVAWLIIYIAHIITSNPLLQRLRFGRTRFTPPIQQDAVDFMEPIITYIAHLFALNPFTAFIARSFASNPFTALIAHIFVLNPCIQRLRFRRNSLVTRPIQQDKQVSTHCCICTEPIMIIDGKASGDFGGVVRLLCNHYYHGSCVWLWMDARYSNALRPNCPMCLQEMQFYSFDYGMPDENDVPDESNVPTKATWLHVPSLT